MGIIILLCVSSMFMENYKSLCLKALINKRNEKFITEQITSQIPIFCWWFLGRWIKRKLPANCTKVVQKVVKTLLHVGQQICTFPLISENNEFFFFKICRRYKIFDENRTYWVDFFVYCTLTGMVPSMFYVLWNSMGSIFEVWINFSDGATQIFCTLWEFFKHTLKLFLA